MRKALPNNVPPEKEERSKINTVKGKYISAAFFLSGYGISEQNEKVAVLVLLAYSSLGRDTVPLPHLAVGARIER